MDIDDWRANTKLKGCSPDSNIVKWFWKVSFTFRLGQLRLGQLEILLLRVYDIFKFMGPTIVLDYS